MDIGTCKVAVDVETGSTVALNCTLVGVTIVELHPFSVYKIKKINKVKNLEGIYRDFESFLVWCTSIRRVTIYA